MKAIVLCNDEYRLLEHVTYSPPIGDEIVVVVKSCSVSQWDALETRRVITKDVGINVPDVVGCTFSGTVAVVGSAVKQLRPGDDVVGMSYGGCCAEYVVVKAWQVVKKPSEVEHDTAAKTVLPGVTALTALFFSSRPTIGESVAVRGASTFEGLCVLQVCLKYGFNVIAIVESEDEQNTVLELVPDVQASLNVGGLSPLAMRERIETETGGLGVDVFIDLGGLTGCPICRQREGNQTTPNTTTEEGSTTLPTTTTNKTGQSLEHFCDELAWIKCYVSCIAMHGTFVTSRSCFEIDPNLSKVLHYKGATVSCLNPFAWIFGRTQIGRYLHMLLEVLELVKAGSIRLPAETPLPLSSQQLMETLNAKPVDRRRAIIIHIPEDT
eukprot:Rmarinus@m.16849